MNAGLYIDEAFRILNPERRDLEPARESRGFSPMAVRGIDAKARTVTALVSTPNPDRYEEIVEPSAFKKWLPTFMANPVLCAGHTYIGNNGEPTVIGHWLKMQVTDDGLLGTCQFMKDDPLADAWWKRFEQKAVRAFSVGWLTHDFEMRAMELGGESRRVRVFTEVELIEVSAVAIPANRESLVRQASGSAALSSADFDDEADAGGMSNRRLNKVLARSLVPALKEILSDDPLGPLADFTRGIVEDTIYRLAAHGYITQPHSHSSPVDDDGPSLDDDDEAGELERALADAFEDRK